MIPRVGLQCRRILTLRSEAGGASNYNDLRSRLEFLDKDLELKTYKAEKAN